MCGVPFQRILAPATLTFAMIRTDMRAVFAKYLTATMNAKYQLPYQEAPSGPAIGFFSHFIVLQDATVLLVWPSWARWVTAIAFTDGDGAENDAYNLDFSFSFDPGISRQLFRCTAWKGVRTGRTGR
jgi:hypothetical protein